MKSSTRLTTRRPRSLEIGAGRRGLRYRLSTSSYALLRSRGSGRFLRLTLTFPSMQGLSPSGFTLLDIDNSLKGAQRLNFQRGRHDSARKVLRSFIWGSQLLFLASCIGTRA